MKISIKDFENQLKSTYHNVNIDYDSFIRTYGGNSKDMVEINFEEENCKGKILFPPEFVKDGYIEEQEKGYISVRLNAKARLTPGAFVYWDIKNFGEQEKIVKLKDLLDGNIGLEDFEYIYDILEEIFNHALELGFNKEGELSFRYDNGAIIKAIIYIDFSYKLESGATCWGKYKKENLKIGINMNSNQDINDNLEHKVHEHISVDEFLQKDISYFKNELARKVFASKNKKVVRLAKKKKFTFNIDGQNFAVVDVYVYGNNWMTHGMGVANKIHLKYDGNLSNWSYLDIFISSITDNDGNVYDGFEVQEDISKNSTRAMDKWLEQYLEDIKAEVGYRYEITVDYSKSISVQADSLEEAKKIFLEKKAPKITFGNLEKEIDVKKEKNDYSENDEKYLSKLENFGFTLDADNGELVYETDNYIATASLEHHFGQNTKLTFYIHKNPSSKLIYFFVDGYGQSAYDSVETNIKELLLNSKDIINRFDEIFEPTFRLNDALKKYNVKPEKQYPYHTEPKQLATYNNSNVIIRFWCENENEIRVEYYFEGINDYKYGQASPDIKLTLNELENTDVTSNSILENMYNEIVEYKNKEAKKNRHLIHKA